MRDRTGVKSVLIHVAHLFGTRPDVLAMSDVNLPSFWEKK